MKPGRLCIIFIVPLVAIGVIGVVFLMENQPICIKYPKTTTQSTVEKQETEQKKLTKNKMNDNKKVRLPDPRLEGKKSIEQALQQRRTIREFTSGSLSIKEISQILWAAQGITEPVQNFRTAPSAGALYPLELYIIVGNVNDLASGVYRYLPQEHALEKALDQDIRTELAQAALNQTWIEDGAAIIVFSAVFERTTQKYGDKGSDYVLIEVGHAAQNVYLQSVGLDLGAGVVGAFDENEVKNIMRMQAEEVPVYIMPVGRK